jgi:integrase
MITKEYPFIPLFEKFLSYSYKGKRLKANGDRIKPQTITNYEYVLRYIKEYEAVYCTILRIRPLVGSNMRSNLIERHYWRKFYLQFTNYLYHQKKFYDNYVGGVIKVIRIFFNFLNKELCIPTGSYHQSFYVNREDIPIVTLMPDQLQFLINDVAFHCRLSKTLAKSKNIFVFGCTVALRASDLFALRFGDIEKVGDSFYLSVITCKTGTQVRIKLPGYALDIINQFKLTAKGRKSIFPPIPLNRFNKHLKEITRMAGWVKPVSRYRTRRGLIVKTDANGHANLFCDMVSSHTMRRTAITTMLMLGMKEHVVRKISGHSGNSKSFYRYVNLVQCYLDNEMDLVFNKLSNVA